MYLYRHKSNLSSKILQEEILKIIFPHLMNVYREKHQQGNI